MAEDAATPVEEITVAELRTALAAFPDDAMVVVSGYEGDMTAAEPPQLVHIRAANADEWYLGEWETAEAGTAPSRAAVYISGRRHGS